MCWRCDAVMLGIRDSDDDKIRRGGAWIADYMRRFDLCYGAAHKMLVVERRAMWSAAVGWAAERYGYDDDDAAAYVLAHGADQPEALQ